MTEAEWLAATDPVPMLDYLRGKSSDRKLRLFDIGCCQRLSRIIENEPAWVGGLDAAEQFADGKIGASELGRWHEEISNWEGSLADFRLPLIQTHGSLFAVTLLERDDSSHGVQYSVRLAMTELAVELEGAACVQRVSEEQSQVSSRLLREIIGNPFRPVTFAPDWRTSTVAAIARGMYESRDFSPMSLLADALQDAGCDNEDILNHCRSNGPHVRGCWVVDLILAKN
ncbi:MAG: hypothetical protein U0791_18425 [Gemmataceae bacterium]